MIFFEKMSLWNYLYHSAMKEPCLYLNRSRFIPLAQRLLNKYASNISKTEFNCIEYTPNIRKNAYNNAFEMMQAMDVSKWAAKMSVLFGIDCQLHCNKFFFDRLYLKFEFIEVAKRYCVENPQEAVAIQLSRRYLDPYIGNLAGFSKIRLRKSSPFPEFVFSLLLLPLVLFHQKRTNSSNENLFYERNIVCLVDDTSTLNMFASLFSHYHNLRFVTERHNRKSFADDVVQQYGISVLGLTKDDLSFFRNRLIQFLWKTVTTYQIMKHGAAFIELFNVIIRGRSQSIRGSNNVFITYEHLETVKAIRNDFLHSRNTKTIFIPKNAYISTQYFHSEIFINYQVMCAAGQHTIDLLKKKRASTSRFLYTGSYDNHRRFLQDSCDIERIGKLNNLKGNKCVVTILSPGICDPTYRHEVKLMQLAQKLSEIKNVLVFIRTKPVQPESRYSNFYRSYTDGYPGIILTDKEYMLLDFLTVTDVFITSISNSASDLALCGGQVFYIDFLKDPELFLSWEMNPEVVIDEKDAYDSVAAWIADLPGGTERNRLKKNMDKLVDYIGYLHKDFETYKGNLLRQVTPLLPQMQEV